MAHPQGSLPRRRPPREKGRGLPAVWLAAIFEGWSATFFLTAFVVGILLWPVMGLLAVGFFGHALYEAYLAYSDDGAFVYH